MKAIFVARSVQAGVESNLFNNPTTAYEFILVVEKLISAEFLNDLTAATTMAAWSKYQDLNN